MKKSKKATSIIEAIIVLLIITTWVTWMYTLFNKSRALTTSTSNKIQAIQIAKQWIEAMTNIRDTNWLRFSSDYINCWNTDVTKFSWTNTCLWENNTTYDITEWSYIIYRVNNSWQVTSKSTWTFWSWTYISDYRVWVNNDIYTQTWTTDNLFPIFTREIIISYLDADWITEWTDSDEPKMKVISLVQWLDNSSSTPHKVQLEQILSNRKK